MPFNGSYSTTGSQGLFFTSRKRIVEEIARLERFILAAGVELGERYVEREEFITRRENDLKLLWEKRNSINAREEKLQKTLASKQDKEPFFKQLNFERTYNDNKIEPRIQFWDEQIGIIDARIPELQTLLRDAELQLQQQRAILLVPIFSEETENQRAQAVSTHSATPAA